MPFAFRIFVDSFWQKNKFSRFFERYSNSLYRENASTWDYKLADDPWRVKISSASRDSKTFLSKSSFKPSEYCKQIS